MTIINTKKLQVNVYHANMDRFVGVYRDYFFGSGVIIDIYIPYIINK